MKIAAVVPCYNSANTVVQTLKSIIHQTLPCHEIIVIDDGSSDGTEAIVRSLEGVKYLYQENCGVSAARNKGVEVAESDWIAFCDADDIWHTDKIEICADCINNNPHLNFLYHDIFRFSNKTEVTQPKDRTSKSIFPFFLENRVGFNRMFREVRRVELKGDFNGIRSADLYTGSVFQWLILGNFISPIATLIKKNTFLASGGFDTQFKLAEDTEFYLRLSKMIEFGYLDLPLAGYQRSQGSLTSNKLSLLQDGLRAFMKNCVDDQAVFKQYRKIIDLSLSRRYARMSYFHLSEFEKTEARRLAIASIKYCPVEKRGWLYLLASMMPKFLLKAAQKLKAGW